MVTRVLIGLAIASMVMFSIAGCSPAGQQHAPASGATSVPRPAPTARSQAPRVGDIAPDFALDTLDGDRKVHLSDFRGKAVLLSFFSVASPLCVKELPAIQRFYSQQQAAGKKFAVLAVNIDPVIKFTDVASMRQRLELTYPIIVDDHFRARTSYQVTDVPVAYIIDQHGLIRLLLRGSLDEHILARAAHAVVAY